MVGNVVAVYFDGASKIKQRGHCISRWNCAEIIPQSLADAARRPAARRYDQSAGLTAGGAFHLTSNASAASASIFASEQIVHTHTHERISLDACTHINVAVHVKVKR